MICRTASNRVFRTGVAVSPTIDLRLKGGKRFSVSTPMRSLSVRYRPHLAISFFLEVSYLFVEELSFNIQCHMAALWSVSQSSYLHFVQYKPPEGMVVQCNQGNRIWNEQKVYASKISLRNIIRSSAFRKSEGHTRHGLENSACSTLKQADSCECHKNMIPSSLPGFGYELRVHAWAPECHFLIKK